MNKSILEQYVSMKAELVELNSEIKRLEAEIQKLEAQEVADTVTCGKRGKKPIQTVKIQGIPMRDITRRKCRLQRGKINRELLKRKLERITEEVEMYVNGIENSEMRRLLKFRFMEGLEWKQVSRLMGEGYTAELCRQKVSRFLRKE